MIYLYAVRSLPRLRELAKEIEQKCQENDKPIPDFHTDGEAFFLNTGLEVPPFATATSNHEINFLYIAPGVNSVLCAREKEHFGDEEVIPLTSPKEVLALFTDDSLKCKVTITPLA